jgi:hypothetical protein
MSQITALEQAKASAQRVTIDRTSLREDLKLKVELLKNERESVLCEQGVLQG